MQSICTQIPIHLLVIKRLRQIQHDRSTLRRGQILHRMEREHRNISQASRFPPLVFRPYRMSRVRQNQNPSQLPLFFRLCLKQRFHVLSLHQFKQLIICTRHTSQINRHNHLCLIRDRLPHFLQTHVKIIRIHIHHHRFRPTMHDHIRRGTIRVRRYNHLIPLLYSKPP